MNIRTRALSEKEISMLIDTINLGYVDYNNKVCKPNNRIAFLLIIIANTGLRIDDALHFSLNCIIHEGNRYRLNIKEKKTGKMRTYTINTNVVNFIQEYCILNEIPRDRRIIPLCERTVQYAIKRAARFLCLEDYNLVSCHSFRKFFATTLYNNNDKNIFLVSKILLHSNTRITEKYINISSNDIEKALINHAFLPSSKTFFPNT